MALKSNFMLHGADYNPDQWQHRPDILEEDAKLMPLVHANIMSVGIFAWAALEPEEGRYTFDWLDQTFERLHKADVKVNLATPSGARPAWMSRKYPEVLRVRADRRRNLHGHRHNHCFTSPVYREKVRQINTRLAGRYKDHPALVLWHISNEYNGDCHCDLCQQAFRDFLKNRYENDLDRLNRAWWTGFWAHTYTDWDQIESPSPIGETAVHGLTLDWKRFVTHQTADFIRAEIGPLRVLTPEIPVTTNFMRFEYSLDYWRIAPLLDVISWDSYPFWHQPDKPDWEMGVETSFLHDMHRSFKQQPFLLMECTPSMANWHGVPKRKRPGMHKLASIQAVAHGSDAVMYFQWRKSRGSSEKFHGAVVDHSRRTDHRVFREVAEVGELLTKLDKAAGTTTQAKVAVLFDWENWWALDDAQGVSIDRDPKYPETCMAHYTPFWKAGISVDIVESTSDLSPYDLVVAPALYMLKPGAAQGLTNYVASGGTLAATYLTGLVNESDLVFLDGWPGEGLRALFGIRSEELDITYPGEENELRFERGTDYFRESYRTSGYQDVIRVEGEYTEVLGVYGRDYYAGRPAVTLNPYGLGEAYYLAARAERDFLSDFYTMLADRVGLDRNLDVELPEGVTVQQRTDGGQDYLFVLNFTAETHTVPLGDLQLRDAVNGVVFASELELEPYGARVFVRDQKE